MLSWIMTYCIWSSLVNGGELTLALVIQGDSSHCIWKHRCFWKRKPFESSVEDCTPLPSDFAEPLFVLIVYSHLMFPPPFFSTITRYFYGGISALKNNFHNPQTHILMWIANEMLQPPRQHWLVPKDISVECWFFHIPACFCPPKR